MLVLVVQDMAGQECFYMLHACHQVVFTMAKSCNQYLMTDVRYWSTHKNRYLAGCTHKGVEPNQCVLSAVKWVEQGTITQGQGSLEEWTAQKIPKWSKDGLMEHIVEFVIVDDQVRQ